MAETVRSAEQSHRKLVTVGQRSSGASELHQMEAMRSSYASQPYGGVRPRSPNRLAKDSREVSLPSNITTAQHVLPVRPAETSRAVRMLRADLLNPSALKGLTPMTMRSTLDAGKSMLGLSSANGSMLQSSYPVGTDLLFIYCFSILYYLWYSSSLILYHVHYILTSTGECKIRHSI